MVTGFGLGLAASGHKFAAAAGRTAKTVSVFGNTQVDTAQSESGGRSILFDSVDDHLEVESTDFQFTGEFTFEYYFRSAGTVSGQSSTFIITNRSNALRDGAYFFGLYYSGLKLFGSMRMAGTRYAINGVNANGVSASSYSHNTWHHLAITRDSSNNLTYWFDGSNESGTMSGASGDVGINASWDGLEEPYHIAIGDYHDSSTLSGTREFNGHLDMIRISDNCRYTSAFTPPSTAFTSDANTLLLIQGTGESDGSTNIVDEV